MSVYEGGVSNHRLAPEHVQRFQPQLAPDTKSWVHLHSPHLGLTPLVRPPVSLQVDTNLCWDSSQVANRSNRPRLLLRGERQAVDFAGQSVPQFSHVHTTLASPLQMEMLGRTSVSGIKAVPARQPHEFSSSKGIDENLKQQAVNKWLLTLHELSPDPIWLRLCN